MMKNLIAILFLTTLTVAFKADNPLFEGKILYKYSFTDLNGNDITNTMAPALGREQRYYINSKNYKAYDENNNWMQLYNSSTNTYYYFKKDNTVMKIDGATKTSQKFIVTMLEKKERIAGYDCNSVQIETDGTTTIYYYSPLVKVNANEFSRHIFGEWNQYLKATGGALSLKFVMTDRKDGYIWTCVASEVVKAKLRAKDFAFPPKVSLDN